MSKVGISALPIEFIDGGHEFVLQIREPGIVRALGFALAPRKIASLHQKVEYDERAVLFVECDPDGERRKRMFAAVPTNRGIDPVPGSKAVWCATGVSQRTGTILHIFELVRTGELLDLVPETQSDVLAGFVEGTDSTAEEEPS